MAIILASNFDYKGKLPHFSNDQFATVAEMKAYSENWIADGQISYCVETKKHYCYKVSNSVDATTGRWRILVEDVDASAVTSDTVKQVSINNSDSTTYPAFSIKPNNNSISFYGGNGINIVQSAGESGKLENAIDFRIDDATTSKKGIVQLNNTLTSTSTTQALTAAQGKALNDAITTANGKITTNTNNIASLTTKVDALGSAYRVKGTKATIAEVVALTDAVVGDVWNVTAAFSLGGKPYPAGTNVVCVTATSSTSHTESNWDALGGTVDLSPYAKSSEVVASGAADQNNGDFVNIQLKNKAGTVISTVEIGEADDGRAGIMTAADKANLDGLVSGTTPAGKATILATSRTIDGVVFNGANNIHHYGICTTAATTTEKAVNISNYNVGAGQGAKIYVRFTLANTAANPTLNVNATGAKPIYYNGSVIPASYIKANHIYTLIYDVTLVTSGVWVIVGDIDTNTTYSAFKGATASAAGGQGLVPAPASGKVNQILKSDGTWADVDTVVNTADCYNRVLKINSIVSGVTVQMASTTSADAKVYFNSTTHRFIAGVTVDGTTTYYNNWAESTEYAGSDYYGTAKSDSGVYSPSYKSVLVELNNGELRRYGWDTSSSVTTVTDSIVVNAAAKLRTARRLDGVSFDGTADRHHLATNIAASSTNGYTCSVTGFALVTGARIFIKMANGGYATNIPHTLNVSSTGAKPLLVNGSDEGTSKFFPGLYASNTTVEAVYDGTSWNIEGYFTSEPTLGYDVVSTVSDIVLS